MKKIVFCLLLAGCVVHGEVLQGRVALSGAWALYPLAVRWGEEFQKLHPDVQFDISAGGAGKGMTDALNGAVDIGMVSRDISAAETARGAFAVAVSKDAVVPMINIGNRACKNIQKNGIAREVFAQIWLTGDAKTWQDVNAAYPAAPVRVYTRSDACGAAKTWAKYFGGSQEELLGIGVYGDPGVGEAVRRDPLGIGYNNVNYAYDAQTKRPVEGLAVVPLDLNGDGTISDDENFYQSRETLIAAIAEDRFPSPPARDLFFVSHGVPKNPVVRAFIEWAITDGQAFVAESGYIQLPEKRLASELERLKGDDTEEQ